MRCCYRMGVRWRPRRVFGHCILKYLILSLVKALSLTSADLYSSDSLYSLIPTLEILLWSERMRSPPPKGKSQTAGKPWISYSK
jgi:hypothetical protein